MQISAWSLVVTQGNQVFRTRRSVFSFKVRVGKKGGWRLRGGVGEGDQAGAGRVCFVAKYSKGTIP